MTAGMPIARAEPPRSRTLRLRIIDIDNEQVKVALALPVGLVSVAQRLGARLLPTGASTETIVAQAEQEGVAHLAWVDLAHRERLELTLD